MSSFFIYKGVKIIDRSHSIWIEEKQQFSRCPRDSGIASMTKAGIFKIGDDCVTGAGFGFERGVAAIIHHDDFASWSPEGSECIETAFEGSGGTVVDNNYRQLHVPQEYSALNNTFSITFCAG